jgi:hypothetical protein
VIADSHYSDGKLRNAVDETVIPFPANQKRGVRDVLKVDKKFRTYGLEDQKKEYHKSPHIEAVYSFLKTQYSLATSKARARLAAGVNPNVKMEVPESRIWGKNRCFHVITVPK